MYRPVSIGIPTLRSYIESTAGTDRSVVTFRNAFRLHFYRVGTCTVRARVRTRGSDRNRKPMSR